MPAPLTVIIPALNAAADLPPALESLLPGLEAGLIREVLLADGGSNDTTRAIAGAAGVDVIDAPRSRAAQLRAGAAAARGEWLLFLPAQTALSRDWPERAVAHMAARSGMAAAFTLKFRSDAPAARGAERRARWMSLPGLAQGLLISRALYEETGGYPDVPLMEDVLLARTLGKRRIVILDAEARASAAEYEREGWFRRDLREAWRRARLRTSA